MFRLFGENMTDFYEPFWAKIKANEYDLSNIEDALYFRLCALRQVEHPDEAVRAAAFYFLRITSLHPEKAVKDAVDFLGCDAPEIMAKRTSNDLNAIVYKVKKRLSDIEAHEIIFFARDQEGRFLFEHKEDLKAHYQKYCANDVENYSIRQIGDSVLHQSASNVLCFDGPEGDALRVQLEILKKNLYQTGGVGIAANQCREIERPYKVILAGVNYDHPEHLVKALTRYQTVLFPRMRVLVNPVILKLDCELTEFSEGCLSVCGPIRGQVSRPKSVLVRYQDINGAYHEETFEGSDARVMLHELDHILNGLVYIEHLIEELSLEQCRQLVEILKSVLSTEGKSSLPGLFLMPKNVFNRNKQGSLFFNHEELSGAFAKMADETLLGLLGKLEDKLNQCRPQI